LLSVASVCHRLAILHDGQIVESGPVWKVMSAPEHPYTRRLIEAVAFSQDLGREKRAIVLDKMET
jgi:peptide/nickel transport system ATP-binding protein